MPRLTEVFGQITGPAPDDDAHDPDVSGADPFSAASRKDIEQLKPNKVEDDAAVHQYSKAFGSIERGINEAKFIIEHVDGGMDKEMSYRALDELADHAYETWRHLVYGEEMVRWVRSR
jgi:hypothetical protein